MYIRRASKRRRISDDPDVCSPHKLFSIADMIMNIWSFLNHVDKVCYKILNRFIFVTIRSKVRTVDYRIVTAGDAEPLLYKWAPLSSLTTVLINVTYNAGIPMPPLRWHSDMFRAATSASIWDHNNHTPPILPELTCPVKCYTGTIPGLLVFLTSREASCRVVNQVRSWRPLIGKELEAAQAIEFLGILATDFRNDVGLNFIKDNLELTNVKMASVIGDQSAHTTFMIAYALPVSNLDISFTGYYGLLRWIEQDRSNMMRKAMDNIRSVRIHEGLGISRVIDCLYRLCAYSAQHVVMKAGWALPMYDAGIADPSIFNHITEKVCRRMLEFSSLPDHLGAWARVAFLVLAYTADYSCAAFYMPARVNLAAELIDRVGEIQPGHSGRYCALVAAVMLSACTGNLVHKIPTVLGWITRGIKNHPEVKEELDKSSYCVYLVDALIKYDSDIGEMWYETVLDDPDHALFQDSWSTHSAAGIF